MGGTATDRFRWKEELHGLETELQRDYGLTPVESRALMRRLGEFLDMAVGSGETLLKPGQIRFTAVAGGEAAGKPLRYCLMVPVSLTVVHASDAEVLHSDGSPALRRVRLSRVCSEAYRQGALLSHEDVALLLGVDLSTVGRLVRACAADGGQRPPTRGFVEDIGPAVSHKERVVRLYCRGVLPDGIAARTGHTLGSVERYLFDFARVIELHRRGVSLEAMCRITAMSPSLVRTYLCLLADLDRPAHAPVLRRLMSRFGPIDEDDGEEVDRG